MKRENRLSAVFTGCAGRVVTQPPHAGRFAIFGSAASMENRQKLMATCEGFSRTEATVAHAMEIELFPISLIFMLCQIIGMPRGVRVVLLGDVRYCPSSSIESFNGIRRGGLKGAACPWRGRVGIGRLQTTRSRTLRASGRIRS